MNAWKNMTPRSVVFGLLVASLLYWLFALPLQQDTPVIIVSFHRHMGLPLFFLAWFGYANLWVLRCTNLTDVLSGLGMLGGVLGLVLGVVLSGVKPEE